MVLTDLDRAPDLATIDLSAPEFTTEFTTVHAAALPVPVDRRTYEERYAELGFGLGVVPRKVRRDDAWWETPAGMLGIVAALLALVLLASGAG